MKIYVASALVGCYLGSMACKTFGFYGLEAIAACLSISALLAAVAKVTE